MKLCKKCGETKNYSEFYKGNCVNSTSYWCKPCQAAYSATYTRQKQKANPGRQHGLDEDEYWGMIWIQDNKCANDTCRAPDPKHVDHDHSHCPGKVGCRKCVRGVLCQRCNCLLGFVEKTPDHVSGLLSYIGAI